MNQKKFNCQIAFRYKKGKIAEGNKNEETQKEKRE